MSTKVRSELLERAARLRTHIDCLTGLAEQAEHVAHCIMDDPISDDSQPLTGTSALLQAVTAYREVLAARKQAHTAMQAANNAYAAATAAHSDAAHLERLAFNRVLELIDPDEFKQDAGQGTDPQ